MLQLHNITKSFTVEAQNITALDHISFDIVDGELLSIVGPSGCGKSTLLRIVANLYQPTSGSITFNPDVTLSMVFQNYALFPYLTVAENIAFGLKMKNVSRDNQRKIVSELIAEMGLSGFENKHPKELSGGMKQRVGIARALAVEPKLLLMDEPFSSLDEFTAENLRTLLLSIWRKRNITIILVTHLVREALELADRIVVLSKGPGTVKNIVVNTLPRPRNMRSKEFFKLEDKLIHEIKGV